ncbi:LOW QUALITY PROTEIN: uncharacterized protein KZ484_008928 [Pholidichthys leucotaenia]
MAYRYGGRKLNVREAYEEQFTGMDTREVTVQRVVNIVEKRGPGPRPLLEHDRYDGDQWYSSDRNYHGERRYYKEDYNRDDHYYNDDHNLNNSPRYEGPYPKQSYDRNDLRHHLSSRRTSRGSHFRNKGRGVGHPQRSVQDSKGRKDYDYRTSQTAAATRDRSPVRREAPPPVTVTVRSGSSTSSRKFSPDREQEYDSPQEQPTKPTVSSNQTPNTSVEGSPHSSASSQEKTSASAAELEEVATASMEPKPTPDENIKARRSEAIKAKALEIETLYRKDCETFCTVVKMRVVKDPSLDNLPSSLGNNLAEIKQRCLDDLRNFVKELDQVLERAHPPLMSHATKHRHTQQPSAAHKGG